MKGKKLILIAGIWWILVALVWISPSNKISISERRKLTQFPEVTLKKLVTSEFMGTFEGYAQDQFPNRFLFRNIKAYTRYYLLGQRDNNGIYLEDGYAVKLEYPMRESSFENSAQKLKYLYEKYMVDKNNKVYLTVIPDKAYFLSNHRGYPSMDYAKIFEIMEKNTPFAKYINISDVLEINDYYKTDIHWKQENLIKVANKIGAEMGLREKLIGEYTMIEEDIPFYGVYYGHSALPMKADKLRYLTNNIIEDSSVYNIEAEKTTSVYDKEKVIGNDPYDIYLSGASALLVIDNPNAEIKRELIVFRDSFGSSLVPLLIEDYSKIILIDIRYIGSDLIGNYIDFDSQDILFMYSTPILNLSSMLK